MLFGSALTSFAQDVVRINQRPLKDLGLYIREKVELRAVDLDAPFSVELSGRLNKSGRLDPATTKYTKTDGDKEVVEVVKKTIQSINDSGYFRYLSQLVATSTSDLLIRAAQNDSGFTSSITIEGSSENHARTVASGLNAMVTAAKALPASQDSRDKDEVWLINSVVALSEGKSIVIKLSLPKSSLREMIERQLTGQEGTPQL